MEMATERRLEEMAADELVDSEKLSVMVSGDGGSESFELTVYHPTSSAIAAFLPQLLDELEGKDEDDAAWLAAMTDLYLNHGHLDPRRTRWFSLSSFDHCETLREHAEAIGADGRVTADDLVKLVAGNKSGDRGNLLDRAIYEQPEIRAELLGRDYEEFRDLLVDEILSIHADFERMKSEILETERQKLEQDTSLSDEERRESLARFQTAVDETEERDFPRVFQDLMRRVSSEAMRNEARNSARFADLVTESRRLQEGVLRKLKPHGPSAISLRDAPDDLARQLIRDNLDPVEANELLSKVIDRFEGVFGVEAIRDFELVDVSQDELSALFTVDLGEDLFDDADHADDCADYLREQYVGLWCALASDELVDKWNALAWISTQLVDRSECVRLAVREAELVFRWAQDWGLKRVYRRIRHDLTRPERRVFLLLYSRIPALGGRIAALDPVVLSFFTGMDDETRGLILLVFVFGIRRWRDERLDVKLRRRWLAHLRLYPLWVALIRIDDREKKRNFAHRETPSSDLFEASGSLLSVEDPLLLALMQEGEDVASWAGKYCDAAEADCVVRHYVDGRSQKDIGMERGTSQQAVSKILRRALDKIRRGLVSSVTDEERN